MGDEQLLKIQQDAKSLRRKYLMVLKLKLILSPLCCFFSCKHLQMCSKYCVWGGGGYNMFCKILDENYILTFFSLCGGESVGLGGKYQIYECMGEMSSDDNLKSLSQK